MPNEKSVVVIETTGHQMADITLIVHGDDERSTHHIHRICLNALRGAIETIRSPESEPKTVDENAD